MRRVVNLIRERFDLYYVGIFLQDERGHQATLRAGTGEAGERMLATILRYGINTQRLMVKEGFAGVREIVFSDEQSRTIFGNYIDLLSTTRKWNIPQKAHLAGARIGCVDPPFHAESALVGA